jgi:F420-non-reducing hydrogenase iron-sulfur subunit
MTVKRIAFLQDLLDFIGLGKRVHLAWISSAEAHRFARVVADFTDHIRAMGPNPLKGLKQTTAGVQKRRPAGRIREPVMAPAMDASSQ